MTRFFAGLAVLLLAALTIAQANQSVGANAERTIALTFDDVTRKDGLFFTGTERTERIIEGLERANVSGAMFFVTTGNVERNGAGATEQVEAFVNAGHSLGNHSHSHLWLWQTDIDEYVADLDLAIANLARYDGVEPFYRFPFLDQGRSVEKRDALRGALKDRGLSNGYVTVDTYDWYLDALAQEAKASGTEFELEALRDLYLDVILKSTEFYDALAQQVLGRSPHHVLLLHENDLAALFVGDLVTELRQRGFRVISAIEAYDDPIAELEPDTLFLGQGRVAALAHEAGVARRDLVSPTEEEEYLRRRFESEVAELPDQKLGSE